MKIIALTLLMSNGLADFSRGSDCAQRILEAEDKVISQSFRATYKKSESGKLIDKEEALAIAKSYVKAKDVVWGAVSIGNFWVVRFDPCSAMIRGGAGMLLISSNSKSVVHTKWER